VIGAFERIAAQIKQLRKAQGDIRLLPHIKTVRPLLRVSYILWSFPDA
jgi:hypothetical protein